MARLNKHAVCLVPPIFLSGSKLHIACPFFLLCHDLIVARIQTVLIFMFSSKLYVENHYRFKKCVLVLLPNVRLTITFELQSGTTRKKATKHFSNGRMTGMMMTSMMTSRCS
jgi:hypothetical protein